MKSVTFKSVSSSNVARFLDNSRVKLSKQNKSVDRYSVTLSPKGVSSATIYFY
jgi:hypothetical protein